MRTQALDRFCSWLEQTPLSQAIQGAGWVVPTVQTVHILAIAAVMSSVLMLDLRLLGTVGRDQPLERVTSRFRPVIWWTLPILLAITMVIGSIAVVDLRLIGLASLARAAARLTSDVLPCTWAAFAGAVITGSLLFSSNAFNYAHNSYFQAKFVCLCLAGINMAVFHLGVGRAIARWGASPRTTPLPARIAGAASLVLRIGVV